MGLVAGEALVLSGPRAGLTGWVASATLPVGTEIWEGPDRTGGETLRSAEILESRGGIARGAIA